MGRDDELRRLERAARAGEGALVVVWGRRRVGKTRLLVEWCRKGGVYWVADTSAAPLQLRNFAETVAGQLPGFADVDYRDWATLLRRLAREARAAAFRGPLVIDELPYLLASTPELPAVLQNFVDHELKQAQLVLALAGSSQRMMQGLALSSEAPLHGRATELFKLAPLPPGCIVDALAAGDAVQGVRAYATWGGIPRYWELAEAFDDHRDAVDALVLDPRGPLHDEPNRLLLEEMPSAIALRPILDVIGAGGHRLSEIASRVGQPATSLARPVARLQELDLVLRETPFGDPERGAKRALYKLADPFLALWFSLVAPKRSSLVQLPRAGRLRLFDAASPRLVSSVWESLCRQAVPRLGKSLGIEYGPAARHWSARGNEWDIVADSADGDALLLGEVKWTEKAPSSNDLERAAQTLIAKGAPPITGRETRERRYAVFVSERPRGKPKLPSNVAVIDARDVMAALR